MEDCCLDSGETCRTGAERRVMCRVLLYWDGLRKNEMLPSLGDIDPHGDIEMEPYLYLVALNPDLTRSRFDHCGRSLAAACGCDPSGKTLAEAVPPSIGEQMLEFFKSAVHYRQPLADCGSFMNNQGQEILYRNIIMPLQDGTGKIGHLLGAFGFRPVGG